MDGERKGKITIHVTIYIDLYSNIYNKICIPITGLYLRLLQRNSLEQINR